MNNHAIQPLFRLASATCKLKLSPPLTSSGAFNDEAPRSLGGPYHVPHRSCSSCGPWGLIQKGKLISSHRSWNVRSSRRPTSRRRRWCTVRSSSIIITTTRHRPFTARSRCTLSLASTKCRSIKSGSTHAASPTRIKTGDLTISSRAVTIGRTEATGTGNELRLSTDTRRDSINECPTSLGLHTPCTDSPQLAAARRLLSFSIRATTLMRWHRDLAARLLGECVAELAVGSLLTPALFAGVPACAGSPTGSHRLNALAPTLDATRRLRRTLGGPWWASADELGEPPEVLRRGGQQHFVPRTAQAS